MNKRTSKNRLYALSSAVLLLVLAGCSGNADNQEGTTSPSPSPSPVISSSPSPSPSVSPSPSPAPSSSGNETEEPGSGQGETKQAEGKFVGLADSHTVEIEIDGKAQAFQLSEAVQETANQLAEGDAVSIEYTEEAVDGDASLKQLTITSLTKKG
ncbi:hypothetical protein M3223_21810 [Paenibacillus pasadenensis]|uniref:hypothetical protein n=1 Tax=Paenibacillus pasadenensis TaxID=217090 RepID=UPI00203C8A85|nr:hypothetical protein [Paenibacillus pasadenensis]MCM3749975.1 hypothetical protein [Paenibacillus pasadenensis]